MTTTYGPIDETATKRKGRKRKLALVAVPLAVIAAGGAAWAAVNLFGFGSIDQDEATMKDLRVEKAHLTGSLVPGKSVGGAADVYNDNDFDIQITGVILKDSSLKATGANCVPSTVTPGGSAGATYPGAGGGAGHLIAISPAITISAGGGKTISAEGVVSQSAAAKGLCGVKADFAVVASVGN
jgi:hypothetical protein